MVKTMGTIGLIIDSTVYLSAEDIEKHDVRVVSLHVLEGEKVHLETDITPEFVFERQDAGQRLTTSQPTPEAFVKAYEEMFAKGYEKIGVITISRGLSGTYQSAVAAQELIDKPEAVHIFDTQNAGFGNELLATEFLRFRSEGDDFETIVQKMEHVIDRAHLLFTVQNLYSLQKGGRLSRTQAFMGTVLRIKPVIRLAEGKLKLVHKERTFKKLYDYFLDAIRKDAEGKGTLHVRIVNHHSRESVDHLKKRLEESYKDIRMTTTDYIGPVFSIHLGKKGFGVTWYAE